MSFRCPQCGQAHEMHATKSITLMQNKEMNEVYYSYLGSMVDDKEQVENLKQQIANIKEDAVTECIECEKTTKVHKWFEAFKEPLKYFEMEQLCHCGGELWMDQIPGTTSYGFVCDDCNWVKPNAKVSGA